MYLQEEILQELISTALAQRKYAYVPYSGFRVGAALLAENGNIYTGCNIENAAYGPSNCAERTAVFKAVSEGVKEFQAICVAGGGEDGVTGICPPCGVCRQVLLEFCDKDFLVILAVSREQYEIYTLGELAPLGFSLEKKAGQKNIIQNHAAQNYVAQNHTAQNHAEQENITGKRGLKLW